MVSPSDLEKFNRRLVAGPESITKMATQSLRELQHRIAHHRKQAKVHERIAARFERSGKSERKGDHKTASQAHDHAANQYQQAIQYYKDGHTNLGQQFVANGQEASVWARTLTQRAGLS